jgi:hypothetical protein
MTGETPGWNRLRWVVMALSNGSEYLRAGKP